MSIARVVAITGCDSGLGWSIAARTAREGLITIAGMYNGTDSNASDALKSLGAHTCALDVTDKKSVSEFRDYVKNIIKDNPEYRLHAVINNAGIMTIGDYEWQTSAMIENTINVNLLGTMRVTSEFLPDMRVNALNNTLKPRIINVASHCGLHSLPGFGPYCASKAGVLAWTQSLRLEHREHGLAVVAFIPGGFIGSSNILLNQGNKGLAMMEHLNDEQKLFYEKRITALTEYLRAAAQNSRYDSLKDENIIETFMKALMDEDPKALYKVESWRYTFYYNLLKLPLPESLHHMIIKNFLKFPQPN